jgi:hypothetical protein
MKTAIRIDMGTSYPVGALFGGPKYQTSGTWEKIWNSLPNNP